MTSRPLLFIKNGLAIFTICTGALWSLASAASCSDMPRRVLALTGVTVVNARGGPVQPESTVVIINGRIDSIGAKAPPAGAQVIDASGRYLIPGLWDMHTHLSSTDDSLLSLYVANGITGLRDMGSRMSDVDRVRKTCRLGGIPVPRLKFAGPILESPSAIARYEKIMGVSMADERLAVGSPEDAIRQVAHLKALEVDFIKIRTNASRDIYFAIAEQARAAHLALVGHAPVDVTLEEASDAGQKSFEHYITVNRAELNQTQWRKTFSTFVRNGTHLVPTFISGASSRLLTDTSTLAVIRSDLGAAEQRGRFVSAELLESWDRQLRLKSAELFRLDYARVHHDNVELVRLAHELGVKVMAGTDVGGPMIFPGFSVHDELEILVRDVGFTPLQALQSATTVPAEFLGLGESVGAIAPGYLADLVLLRANPLERIENTRAIEAVVFDGEYIPAANLESRLAEVESSTRAKRLALAHRVKPLDAPVAGASQPIRLPASSLALYAGKYEVTSSLTLTVSLIDGGLVLEVPTIPAMQLVPVGEKLFTSPGVNGEIVFSGDAPGVIDEIAIRNPNRTVKGRRVARVDK